MSTISFMAQLTAVNNWLTSGHWSCCWDGCTRPFNFLLYGDEDMWYQQDGVLPYYHHNVRAYLDNTFPNQWIGCRGSVEYPPKSPDLTPPDFFLWGYLKDTVYSTKPATLQELWQETEQSWAAIPAETLVATCQSGSWKSICCFKSF
jgi:hypothetical protein